jgi:tRNA(adenine34) deaminase
MDIVGKPTPWRLARCVSGFTLALRRKMDDERWLRRAIELAEQSVAAGDYAFGSLIVDGDGAVLVESMQTLARSGNWLAHAEMNVLQESARRWKREDLARATLYTSTEPCPMCTGAIGWSVNRLVFGLSQAEMYRRYGAEAAPPRFIDPWNCRVLLDRLEPPMEVIGPLLEEEAAGPHLKWMERWLT